MCHLGNSCWLMFVEACHINFETRFDKTANTVGAMTLVLRRWKGGQMESNDSRSRLRVPVRLTIRLGTCPILKHTLRKTHS